MANKIARKIKNVSDQFRGRAALFNVVPPMEDYDESKWDHVVVSTAYLAGSVETYIFPSDSEGNVQDWSELYGSTKGCDSWSEALHNAGYDIGS
jgi:hypothetical protein